MEHMIDIDQVELAVTGGSGFIGRGVLEFCSEAGLSCRALSRCTRPPWAGQGIEWARISSYADTSVVTKALSGAKYILHLADNPARSDERDVDLAIAICDAVITGAKSGGAEGIIVASSVYAAEDDGAGASSYGSVKRAVEQRILTASGLKTVILRLPPVYGPGGRGGLGTLAKLLQRGLLLPLGMATAPRSYVSRRNLASLILTMVGAGEKAWRNASGMTFEPSDGAAVSTRDLVKVMASQMGVAARLLPVPLGLIRIAAAVVGKKEMISSAIDRLDTASVNELDVAFGWRPRERMPESLAFLRGEFSSS